MKKNFGWMIGVLMTLSVSIISWRSVEPNKLSNNIRKSFSAKELFQQYVNNLYSSAHLQQSGLDLSVFQKAFTGFTNLKLANKLPQNSSVITVIDFSKPSREKRMWIIDLLGKSIILNTWVAHGQGSGEDMAEHFSDDNDSHQSSLGFYLTDDVYMGKHGRSLRLDGMDPGFNASARKRSIVVHAADYVSPEAIKQHGRLGRSYGCPAVSPAVADMVINTIKGKTVLFINGNDITYNSQYLNENLPENIFREDSSLTAGIRSNTNGPADSLTK